MSARRCDGCTQCCSLLPVLEIGLKAFCECPHLRPVPTLHPGCGIYPRRPASCRLWSCMWLLNDSFDDALRPDRCGVVFDEVPDLIKVNGVEHVCVQAWVRRGVPEDFWETQPVLAVVLAMLDKRVAVLFRLADHSGFAVWRDSVGDHRSPPLPPQSFSEPEAGRYARAQKMMDDLPG